MGKSNPFAPRRYGELQRITPRVWLWRNITNSSFVVGDDAVAVVDTQVNLPGAEMLLAAVRSVTSKPIRYAINTHYHWDHTNGNSVFKREGAAVVASKLTADFMVSRSPRQKEFLSGRGFELGPDPLLPEITFEGEHALALGGVDLKLFFAGAAESDDATAVHVPGENVLMSGDTVMTGSFPIFGQPCWDEGLQGDGAWERTIDRLLALKPAHILPGHGPLAHDAEIDLLRRIQRYFVEEVSRLTQKGVSLDAILKDLEPRLPSWIASIPLVWGTPRYAILRVWRGLTRKSSDAQPGWQQFKPPVIAAVPLPPRALSSESHEDFLAMAHEASEGGDTPLQLSILSKAAEKFPGSDDILCAYADALVEASRPVPSVLEKGDLLSRARDLWERVLARNPRHPRALAGKGRYHVMLAFRGGDDPRRGMDLLSRLLEQGAEGRLRAEAEFYLGIGHRRLGDEPAAAAQFAKALRADPSFMPARLAGNAS